MTMLRERVEVKCAYHYLIHHAERYFTVHRRNQVPGTFGLTVDMSKVGLPGKTQARHDVRIRYEARERAEGRKAVALSWDPDDRFVPTFVGELYGEPLEGGMACLILVGSYEAPMGRLGAVFDAVLGRRIAAVTAIALLQDMKQFVESDYEMALATSLASSPKE